MSTNVHVYGIKPPDDKWKKMKTIYYACRDAKISPPKEVSEYFEYNDPNENGVHVELKNYMNIGEEGSDKYYVELNLVPKDVKFIVFSISY